MSAAMRLRCRRGTASCRLAPGLPARPAVRLGVDPPTWDSGSFQRFQSLSGQLRGKLDKREVGMDRDVAEIAPMQPTLVGDSPDDRARPDLVPLSDRDPIRRHPLAGAAHRLTRTVRRPFFVPVFLPAELWWRLWRHQELFTVS